MLDEVRQLHCRKSLDYGTDADPLQNIRESAAVVNMQPWAGAILRVCDKMHRIKAFFTRGRVEFDGIEDTLLDGCAYFAIALTLYREQISKQPAQSPPLAIAAPLDLAAIRLRAARYAGPFTPTYQSLASDVLALANALQHATSSTSGGGARASTSEK